MEILLSDHKFQEGFYYFGIFGFRDCGEFTLSYTVLSACDCATPQSGECLAGSNKCTCAAGYVGPKCSLEYTPSPSGQQNARSNFEGWSYYAIEVDEQPRQLRFELRKGGDEDTTDFLDMYVAANRPPFIHDYDYRTIGRSDQTLERILLSQVSCFYSYTIFSILSRTMNNLFSKKKTSLMQTRCTFLRSMQFKYPPSM